MIFACVNVKASECLCAESVVREHTLNSKLHSHLGTVSHEGLVLNFLEATDVAGMMSVVLLLKLSTGENCLGSIDDDNELAAICVGSELGSVLSLPRA